jgi:glucose/arabinose dehydrogenase
MMKMFFAVAALIACMDSQMKSATAASESSASAGGATRHAAVAQPTIRLEQVGGRFTSPVYLTSPPGDPRLFVVEQAGRIRVVKDGATLDRPFLDISSRVRSGGEQGLLSMAFHPDYSHNGYFFVNFTDREGDTRVERFKVSRDADVADAQSSKLVLSVDQPYGNHNGGLVMFGPDGMLYIGMGDGGSGGDPHGNGQNKHVLLGKLLRLDVSKGDPYAIPAGNPYADGSDGKPEIWAIGLRNPWRFAFDPSTKLLFIADVGQDKYEEVDVVSASRPGVNYGWNIMEADHCYSRDNCDRSGLEAPKTSYGHAGGACSVTGGFVYRGRRIPAIAGQYFYSDYCAGWLRSFRVENGAAVDSRDWKMDSIGHVVSFGEDASREMYIVAEGGRVFRFAGATSLRE